MGWLVVDINLNTGGIIGAVFGSAAGILIGIYAAESSPQLFAKLFLVMLLSGTFGGHFVWKQLSINNKEDVPPDSLSNDYAIRDSSLVRDVMRKSAYVIGILVVLGIIVSGAFVIYEDTNECSEGCYALLLITISILVLIIKQAKKNNIFGKGRASEK